MSLLIMSILNWSNSRNNPETRSKALTFILCLVFSFIAWLSIKLSREATTVFPLELQVSNLPDNILFNHLSDSTFAISMQTTGIRILSNRSIRGDRKLETDFGSLQRMRGENENIFYFTAAQAEIRFSLLNEIPRTSIKMHPDTLFFVAKPAFRKKVPIIVQKNIDFRPGFKLYNFPIVSPDSVYVMGPESFKDSVNFIYTTPVTASSADKNIQQMVQLINPFPTDQIKLSQKLANITVPVEEYTEATVELSLIIDCPQMLTENVTNRLLLFPESVNIHYLVAMKDINLITSDMFKVKVACPDALTEGRDRLPVTVEEHPGFVDIIRTRPSEVEYVWIRD